jgi:hypothetical protein
VSVASVDVLARRCDGTWSVSYRVGKSDRIVQVVGGSASAKVLIGRV